MSLPSSPAGGGQPLQPVSHNAQRESALFSSVHHLRDRMGESPSARDSSVHEKINQFNTMSSQFKQHERKTADAALKRAMLGREEAEADARRYRDEVKVLRKQVEEGKERERKMAERLEDYMEKYGRHKEMHEHAKEAWEKEIRRARKETFKVQSHLYKAQEQLKSCQTAQKAAEEGLHTERERCKAREQEAFDAQYRLVGLQEQLDQALGRVKALEQELDAIKTLAKNEAEVRRLASDDGGDNSDGPRKRARRSSISSFSNGNPEIETITMLWEWEKQRADRALEQVDFLEAECHLKLCAAGQALRRASSIQRSSPRKRASMLISDAGDPMILSESRRASAETKPTPRRSKTSLLRGDKEPRRSTIFLPAEGIFRTVSEAEADAMAAKSAGSSGVSPTESAPSLPITPTDSDPMYRRTPSVDPPDFAMLTKERTSLLSLLDAPHRQEPTPVFNIPTTPGPAAPGAHHPEPEDEANLEPTHLPPREITIPLRDPTEEAASQTGPLTDPLPSTHNTSVGAADTITRPTRLHTTTSHYHPTTTTTTTTTTIVTKVPLRSEPDPADGPTLAQRLLKMQRTPSRQQIGTASGTGGEDVEGGSDRPSFDATNPALTPTMTREQALAQIRERRGRARSVGRVGSGGSSAGNGNTVSGNGAVSGEGRRKVSGGIGNGAGEVRRKVSGGMAGTGELRRKVSNGELAAGTARRAAGDERGREREVRREVSAPTSTANTGGTLRGAGAGARRVRS
ncbi:hypothetical protein C8A01DRAFT_37916 [Parachaetomium inaequale]|uniref:Uncharacterized protein n=1 Tax=Parachaetomium inaequale TaxID=2588326 RepID=A0AAN6PF67_9PEZI|nr:hypothetical protein C8A01DRAFT_37916 [Parachaetomium inaequale]